MYTFFLDACTQHREHTWYLHSADSSEQTQFECLGRSDTHSHRFDGFDQFLALQALQDLVDLRQRKVALEADVSAPDSCSTEPHLSYT